MSEPNKRHNRKIWRACPVCGGRVIVAHRNNDWWVYCEEDRTHIPQTYFNHAHEAIVFWNEKANKQTRADKVRELTNYQLAVLFAKIENSVNNDCALGISGWLDWLNRETDDDLP